MSVNSLRDVKQTEADMRGITPCFLYSGWDIDELNARMWRDIQIHGRHLTFGTPGGQTKEAIEIFSVTQLYGEALQRLYRGDVPKGWAFRGSANGVYVDMLKDVDPHDQPYTYGQRLHDWLKLNQAENMRNLLKQSIDENVQTNRLVGVILHPEDVYLQDPPCWNWFQLRKMEDNLVSLRTLFRSHCFVNADYANYGALTRVFIDEIIRPAGGEMSELINVSTSAQIGAGDVNTVFDHVGNWLGFRTFFNSSEPVLPYY